MGLENNDMTKYRQIREWVQMMEDEIKELKRTYINATMSETGVAFREDVFNIVLPYTLDYITTKITPEEIIDCIGPYEIIDSVKGEMIYKKDDMSDDYKDFLKNTMKTIKSYSLAIMQLEKEEADIKEKASEIMNEYVHYYASQQLFNDKKEKLRIFKEANELEVDEATRRTTDRRIKILENEISFGFLTERLDKYGDEERERIKKDFFDDKRSMIILNKFRSRAKSFGFKQDIFKFFLNIEENFLPEEYHMYNNLFLVIYMRYVAYASYDIKSDRIYVAAINSAIASLVYHTFEDPQDEKDFIEIIKGIIDKFRGKGTDLESYMDSEFASNNKTYKNHPERIKTDEMNYEVRKGAIFAGFEDYHIDNPYLDKDHIDLDEAQKYLKDKINELKESQLKDIENTVSNENADNIIKDVEKLSDNITSAIDDIESKKSNDNISDDDEHIDETNTEISNEPISQEEPETSDESETIEEGNSEYLSSDDAEINADDISAAVESLSDN